MAHLSEKVALVTGGSRGIGAAIACQLAKDGAHVAITFRENLTAAKAVTDEINSYGKKATALQVDMTDANVITSIVDKVIENYGRLDILVNNAGYMDNSGTALGDIPLETIDRTIMTNIRAAFLVSQYASKHLGAGGRIINIGSCLGNHVPGPGFTLYSMSKSAITGLTKGLARDLAGKGVTVNQVSPGPIDTDMNPANGPTADFQRSLIALGRYGTPAEIAATVCFLASQDAAFITGSDIVADGGMSI